MNKYCKDCTSFIDSKPLPACNSSKNEELVRGGPKRICMIERLDGIGRCGTMGNNFTKQAPKPKIKPKPKVSTK